MNIWTTSKVVQEFVRIPTCAIYVRHLHWLRYRVASRLEKRREGELSRSLRAMDSLLPYCRWSRLQLKPARSVHCGILAGSGRALFPLSMNRPRFAGELRVYVTPQ